MCQVTSEHLQEPLQRHLTLWVSLHPDNFCHGWDTNIHCMHLMYSSDDATRVILKGADDYINANYINVRFYFFNFSYYLVIYRLKCYSVFIECLYHWELFQMEIPASSIINRYIACQGPLPNTCTDFWQMTWEQGSSMVVMLTTQVERGRVSVLTLSFSHGHCSSQFILRFISDADIQNVCMFFLNLLKWIKWLKSINIIIPLPASIVCSSV